MLRGTLHAIPPRSAPVSFLSASRFAQSCPILDSALDSILTFTYIRSYLFSSAVEMLCKVQRSRNGRPRSPFPGYVTKSSLAYFFLLSSDWRSRRQRGSSPLSSSFRLTRVGFAEANNLVCIS